MFLLFSVRLKQTVITLHVVTLQLYYLKSIFKAFRDRGEIIKVVVSRGRLVSKILWNLFFVVRGNLPK